MINLRNEKKNNEKGITMIALVITIVVLIILASVATYSGIQSINSAKLTLFTTELKIMQTQVNSLNQKMVNNETITINGKIYKGDGTSKDQNNQPISGIQEIGNDLEEKDKKTLQSLNFKEEEIGKFKVYDVDIKEQLKIEGVSQDVLVDVANRQIVSRYGISYNGNQWYTLSQVPDSLYNVEYDNSSLESTKPTFDVTYKKIGTENRWEVTISNIVYEANVSNWQVKYRILSKDEAALSEEKQKEKDKDSYWNNSDSMTFVVNESGEYRIKILNGKIESEVKIINIISDAIFGTEETSPYLPEGATVTNNKLSTGVTIKDSNENEWTWVVTPKSVTKDCKNDGEIESKLREYSAQYYKDGYVYSISEVATDTWNENTGLSETEYYSNKSKMLNSIQTYGGFYIGKYEVGDETTTNLGLTGRTGSSGISQKAVIKQNMYPYTYVTCAQAQELSKNFETGDKTTSLLYGIQHDLVCKYIEENTEITKAQIMWDTRIYGNYRYSEYIINKGKYSADGGYTWNIINNQYEKKTDKEVLLTTGLNENFSMLNIYDFSGNVWECTLEITKPYLIINGGGFGGLVGTMNYRLNYIYASCVGFRPTMY